MYMYMYVYVPYIVGLPSLEEWRCVAAEQTAYPAQAQHHGSQGVYLP